MPILYYIYYNILSLSPQGVSGGTQSSSQFHFDTKGNLQITYTTTNNFFSSVITFICSDEEGNGTFDMQNGPFGYEGTLSSRYACFKPGPLRLSTVDIIVIVVFILFISYFIISATFLAYTRRGTSLIPAVLWKKKENVEEIRPMTVNLRLINDHIHNSVWLYCFVFAFSNLVMIYWKSNWELHLFFIDYPEKKILSIVFLQFVLNAILFLITLNVFSFFKKWTYMYKLSVYNSFYYQRLKDNKKTKSNRLKSYVRYEDILWKSTWRYTNAAR